MRLLATPRIIKWLFMDAWNRDTTNPNLPQEWAEENEAPIDDPAIQPPMGGWEDLGSEFAEHKQDQPNVSETSKGIATGSSDENLRQRNTASSNNE